MDYKKLFDDVTAGNENALPAYIRLKEYIKDVTQYAEALKEQAANEFFTTWSGKEQVIHGATVSRHQSGSYAYDDNPDWVRVNNQRKEIEDHMKAIIKDPSLATDEETGVITPAAKYTPTKEGITISFKKQ